MVAASITVTWEATLPQEKLNNQVAEQQAGTGEPSLHKAMCMVL